jgi:hypothetical protein
MIKKKEIFKTVLVPIREAQILLKTSSTRSKWSSKEESCTNLYLTRSQIKTRYMPTDTREVLVPGIL